MKSIRERIRQFNKAVKDDYYHLTLENAASIRQLAEIKTAFELTVPMQLEWFYKEIGGIQGEAEEYTLNVFSAAYLLEKLNEKKSYYRINSMGIVDLIRFSWGNDRDEFDEEALAQKIAYLNANYKGIGLYRYDWGLEEANYLYVDKNGNFGEVRYHQDDFHGLWKEHFTPMLKASQAQEQLDSMIIRIINKLEEGIKNKDE